MRFPSIRNVARELVAVNREVDCADDEGCDVRLQVYDNGRWAIRFGDSQYDLDHHGYWGASSVPGRSPRGPRVLRHVRIRGTDWTVLTWDTQRRFDTGQWKIGYTFYDNAELIFSGEDCGVSPMHGIDSDDALAGLLSFLSLRPGDTDADYFKDYTPDQMDWAQANGEELSMFVMEVEEHNLPIFEDIDTCHGCGAATGEPHWNGCERADDAERWGGPRMTGSKQ
jgi:hypothetical protein